MKFYSYLFIALFSISLMGQKRLSHTYAADGVKELCIHSNEIFEIKVSTSLTDMITIHSIIDGEIFASTLLNTQLKGKSLEITTGKTPDYIPFNDKLSAHKVMAIELEISIPTGMNISIHSTLASVETTGELGQVRIDLGRGSFVGREFRFRESAKIHTIAGHIDIELQKATIAAQSRNGHVVIASNIEKGAPLTIESLDGDITIHKSQ